MVDLLKPATESRILRLQQIKARTGLSKSTLYVYMANKQFPRSIQIGPRATGWLASDVDAWIDSRVKAAKD